MDAFVRPATLSEAKGSVQQPLSLPTAGAGSTTGMLGYMFWAAGCQGNGTGCTFPPNTCENGMGGAATAFSIPIPMPALRQN